jgi:antirestriction protein ArdC
MKATQIFETVTASIVEAIEAGIANPSDWTPPWRQVNLTLPRNASTGKAYQGGNVLALWINQAHNGYETATYATYKQWAAMGAQVRKGEHGTPLVKWSPIQCKDHGKNERCRNCGRLVPFGFTVFNAGQVEGYEAPEVEAPVLSEADKLEAVEAFYAASGIKVTHAPGRAFYAKVGDYISVPAVEDFTEVADYYATLGHEMIHATGHESRLDRTFGKRFGDEAYAAEELVAELGAAFLAATLGIAVEAPRPDHAQYLASWLRVLRAEPQALFDAAGKASKAVGWLEAQAAVEVAA